VCDERDLVSERENSGVSTRAVTLAQSFAKRCKRIIQYRFTRGRERRRRCERPSDPVKLLSILPYDLVRILFSNLVIDAFTRHPTFPSSALQDQTQLVSGTPTIGLGDSDSDHPNIYEGKYQVSRRNFSHRLVEWIPASQSATTHLVNRC